MIICMYDITYMVIVVIDQGSTPMKDFTVSIVFVLCGSDPQISKRTLRARRVHYQSSEPESDGTWSLLVRDPS